jgi:hypothetical protein
MPIALARGCQQFERCIKIVKAVRGGRSDNRHGRLARQPEEGFVPDYVHMSEKLF